MTWNGAKKMNYKRTLAELHGLRCAYCGKSKRFEDLTIDHVKPISAGGTNHIHNLALACGPCNQAKANKAADKFSRQLARNKTYS